MASGSSASPKACRDAPFPRPLPWHTELVVVVFCSSTGSKAAQPPAQAHSQPGAGLPKEMVLPDKIRVAARAGYVDTVRAWLESDDTHDINDVAAGEDDPRVRGCGLLFSAVQYPFPGDQDNSEAMVSYLVARGADVRHRPLGTGPTPLHMACSRALTGAVRVLVRAGADVNAPFRLARAPANTGDAGRRRVDGARGGPPLIARIPRRPRRASAWPYGALIEVGGLASAARRIRKQSQASPGAPGQEPSTTSPP